MRDVCVVFTGEFEPGGGQRREIEPLRLPFVLGCAGKEELSNAHAQIMSSTPASANRQGRALLTGRLVAPAEMIWMTEPFHGLKNANGVGGMHNGVLLDVASQMVPWRAAVRDALAHREWPLLNRSILGGDILAAAAQPAANSPITWLACLLPAAESFNVSTSLTLLLAALGAFLFAAEPGCDEAAALFAAIAWMLSTPVSTFAMWPLGAAYGVFELWIANERRRAMVTVIVAGIVTLERSARANRRRCCDRRVSVSRRTDVACAVAAQSAQ